MMRFVEPSRDPLVIAAIDLVRRVDHGKVSQNSRPLWIGGDNLRLAGRKTFPLVIVDGFGHVGRNRAVVVAPLLYAIDLYGQRDRNRTPLQFPCEFDNLCSAPTVSIKNDPDRFFAGRGRRSAAGIYLRGAVVGGLFPFVISENFNMHCRSVSSSQIASEQNFWVPYVVSFHKAAKQADHNRLV